MQASAACLHGVRENAFAPWLVGKLVTDAAYFLATCPSFRLQLVAARSLSEPCQPPWRLRKSAEGRLESCSCGTQATKAASDKTGAEGADAEGKPLLLWPWHCKGPSRLFGLLADLRRHVLCGVLMEAPWCRKSKGCGKSRQTSRVADGAIGKASAWQVQPWQGGVLTAVRAASTARSSNCFARPVFSLGGGGTD